MMQFALLLSLAFFSNFAQGNDNAHLRTIVVNAPTSLGELRTEIHFAEKDIAVAKRAEEIIKRDLTKAVEYFHHIPRDIIHFNIDPYKRLTNGNATVFPTNTINLFNFPASNLEHLISLEDWLLGLIFHEFIHIIHLEQTNGYLEVGRNIFGTIAKVPTGIVPHWFTEGIAVWAESHFLQGGRLKNELLNKDLWEQFQNKNFCSTIDCLDTPGVYPHGQLAYWAGGHFMNYLESKKPNTVQCLVFENSSEIPFFLNDVFLQCTGRKAQDLFSEFREDYLKKYNENIAIKENGENVFGSDDYQKGRVKIGDLLLKVERQKKKSALVRYDLKDKISSFRVFSEPIAHVGDSVAMDDETTGILVAFHDDPQFVQHNKTWKIINADTLLEEKTLSFSHDPSYVIPVSANDFLSFSYEENHWRAYYNEKLIREWPLKYNIVAVSKTADEIILKINTADVGTSTYVADQNLAKIEMEGKIVEFSDSENKAETEVQFYPQLNHLKPHYWFLAVGNSNSPSSIGAMTSLSDPMMVHALSATALLYPSVSRAGGELSYTHTNHLWKQFFLLSRDYSTNSWSNNLNISDEIILGTSYLFELKKWLYKPQINAGQSTAQDALSAYKNNYWTFIQSVSYQALSPADFWNLFQASLEWGVSEQSVGDPYYKLQSKINFTNNFSDDFSLHFKGAYGKLYKNKFSEGILYGGGIALPQQSRRYEFYGIPYGDAYGNEVLALRLTSDFNFWNIYRGRNFFPVFLKEAHLLLGIERLAADRIYIDHHFYRNEKINSFFAGTKLLTNMFYFVPIDINFIFSSTKTPAGTYVNVFNFFLKLEL